MIAKESSAVRAGWLVGVLLITALISYSDRMILSVLVDRIRADLNLTDSSIGFLQGPAFTIVYVCAALVFGRLTDRSARKPLLCAGVLLWCAATILCGYAPSGGVLLAGRLLLGVGEAVLLPTAFSLVADVVPARHLGVANGTVLLGTIIGGPLGIALGGVLLATADLGIFAPWPIVGSLAPWRCVLVLMGCAGLLSPLLLMSVKEPKRRQRSESASSSPTAYLIANSSTLAPLYAIMAFLSIGDYGLVAWVPTALSRRYGWDAGHLGIVFGITTAAAGVLGSMAGGWFSDLAERRDGSPARLVVSMVAVVFAAGAAIMICLGRAELVVGGLGLWVFASSVASIGVFCVLQEVIAPEYRGTGVAIMTLCNTLFGLGCGPTLVGAATDHLFQASIAVDDSISLISIPSAGVAFALIVLARATLQRRRGVTRAN